MSLDAVRVTPQCTTITPKKPMKATWSNAAFIVEFPYPPGWPSRVISQLDNIRREYPPGRISVTPYRANGTAVEVANGEVMGAANADFDLFLSPTPNGGFTEGDEFVHFRICGNPAINNARLYWRRVGK